MKKIFILLPLFLVLFQGCSFKELQLITVKSCRPNAMLEQLSHGSSSLKHSLEICPAEDEYHQNVYKLIRAILAFNDEEFNLSKQLLLESQEFITNHYLTSPEEDGEAYFRVLLLQGSHFYNDKEYEKAIEIFEKIQKFTRHPQFYINLSGAYKLVNNKEKEIENLLFAYKHINKHNAGRELLIHQRILPFYCENNNESLSIQWINELVKINEKYKYDLSDLQECKVCFENEKIATYLKDLSNSNQNKKVK